jgi:hypothetical protein
LYGPEDEGREEVSAYFYEIASSMEPEIKFTVMCRQSVCDDFQLQLQSKFNTFSVKCAFLEKRTVSHEELLRYQKYFCALMSAVIAGQHREKVFHVSFL